jgi:hypothetical protein
MTNNTPIKHYFASAARNINVNYVNFKIKWN